MYKGPSIRLTANFSSEAMEARRQRDGILKSPERKKKSCQPRILYLAKPSFEREIKTSRYRQEHRSSLLIDLPYKEC